MEERAGLLGGARSSQQQSTRARGGLLVLLGVLLGVFGLVDVLRGRGGGAPSRLGGDEEVVDSGAAIPAAADAPPTGGGGPPSTPALDGAPFDVILGRPGRESITLSVWCDVALELVVRATADATTDDTAVAAAATHACAAGNVSDVVLRGLSPDTRYAYVVEWRRATTDAAGGYNASATHHFRTVPAADYDAATLAPLTVTISADSHLYDHSMDFSETTFARMQARSSSSRPSCFAVPSRTCAG